MLMDSQGRQMTYLRLSLTDRCNLRCTYCMPESGNRFFLGQETLTLTEIDALAKVFRDLGLSKVRLTGGEPALRDDLVEIIRIFKQQGFEEITMTSNGLLLADHIASLKAAGLNRVNLSLDTLDADTYRALTRGGDVTLVLKVIKELKEHRLVPIKLNTVLLKGTNDGEVGNLLELSKDPDIELRFIELMPLGMGLAHQRETLTLDWLLEEYPELREVESPAHSVAKQYRYKDYEGKVGLIRPLSCNFCKNCNRLRVSAKGQLRLCLHEPTVLDLKKAMEDGEDLEQLTRQAVTAKPLRHDLAHGSKAGVNMNEIGG